VNTDKTPVSSQLAEILSCYYSHYNITCERVWLCYSTVYLVKTLHYYFTGLKDYKADLQDLTNKSKIAFLAGLLRIFKSIYITHIFFQISHGNLGFTQTRH
jgi:hypothetical protein